MEKLEQQSPASITTLGSLEIAKVPGVNIDDRLRMVPGFSGFRRSSSIVANPTTQGVSLRGLGSSGASRTLVLWDGVPLNDPFGGWLYWTRIPSEEIDRIEVSRGATTSLFGDRTMSGSVALFTRPAQPWRVNMGLEGGNRGTLMPSAGVSHVVKKLGVSAFFRAFDTDGYLIVPGERAGRIDTPANVRFVSGATKLDYSTDRQRISFKIDILAEERANGTPFQRNSTGLGTLSGNYSRDFGAVSTNLIAYHSRQQYHQSFSTLAADRNSERLTSLQDVPSTAWGGGAFLKARPARLNWTVGADAQHVDGTSFERVIPTGLRVGGGQQTQSGIFAQGDAKLGPIQVFFGSRGQFAGKAGNFFAPNGGLAWGKSFWRLRASAYRSFRAPTLNELYREFRAGNAVTQANDLLQPEKLWGVESGGELRGETWRLSGTLFHKEVDGVIANVTLVNTPAQIIRQRRNAAAATVRGLETDFEKRWRQFRWEASYLYADSQFSSRVLLPQVPKHQGSAQMTYSRKGTLVTFGLRSSALQFEDDRNTLVLPGFAVLQVTARQDLPVRGLSATLAVENLTDRRIYTGYTPFPQTGAPLLWRAGLRWQNH